MNDSRPSKPLWGTAARTFAFARPAERFSTAAPRFTAACACSREAWRRCSGAGRAFREHRSATTPGTSSPLISPPPLPALAHQPQRWLPRDEPEISGRRAIRVTLVVALFPAGEHDAARERNDRPVLRDRELVLAVMNSFRPSGSGERLPCS